MREPQSVWYLGGRKKKQVVRKKNKKLINEGIKQAPNLCRLVASKIKNKNVRKGLESDAANYLVEEKQKKILIIYSVSCKK